VPARSTAAYVKASWMSASAMMDSIIASLAVKRVTTKPRSDRRNSDHDCFLILTENTPHPV
jgi:hypothetical protein